MELRNKSLTVKYMFEDQSSIFFYGSYYSISRASSGICPPLCNKCLMFIDCQTDLLIISSGSKV